MVNAQRMDALAPATLAFDVACTLGEGIVWCERDQALWWTDIEARRIWRQRPEEEAGQWWRTPGRVGVLALCESGRLLLGMEDGLYFAEPGRDAAGGGLACEHACAVPLDGPAMRINDGRVDRSGNFVFGTLNEDPARARIGRFFQYSTRHGLRPLDIEPVAIANGICFRPDGKGMYYCDSLQRRIMQADYDAASARVGPPRVFATVDAPGEPDGAIVDAAGCVWSAQWGASRVTCYLPGGSTRAELAMPATQPTCMAFAGDRLDALFVTSARIGLDEAGLREQPAAGGVFRAHAPGIRGMADTRFADA